MIKSILNFTSAVLIFCLFTSCHVNRIYIVRHAEKAAEMQKDPVLTTAGERRAVDLSNLLRNKNITGIYSTNTIRTKSTVKPLADELGLPVIIYAPDTVSNLLGKLKSNPTNALIVGHSNTVLPMLSLLGLQTAKQEIPDWEYDNIFVVTLRKKGNNKYALKLKSSKYGQNSLPF
jgi:broad specificity phosphatase PhoE